MVTQSTLVKSKMRFLVQLRIRLLIFMQTAAARDNLMRQYGWSILYTRTPISSDQFQLLKCVCDKCFLGCSVTDFYVLHKNKNCTFPLTFKVSFKEVNLFKLVLFKASNFCQFLLMLKNFIFPKPDAFPSLMLLH